MFYLLMNSLFLSLNLKGYRCGAVSERGTSHVHLFVWLHYESYSDQRDYNGSVIPAFGWESAGSVFHWLMRLKFRFAVCSGRILLQGKASYCVPSQWNCVRLGVSLFGCCSVSDRRRSFSSDWTPWSSVSPARHCIPNTRFQFSINTQWKALRVPVVLWRSVWDLWGATLTFTADVQQFGDQKKPWWFSVLRLRGLLVKQPNQCVWIKLTCKTLLLLTNKYFLLRKCGF